MWNFALNNIVNIPSRYMYISTIALFCSPIRKCELIHQVDDDDFLYRVVTPSVRHGAGGAPTSASQREGILQDFILLASKRKPCSNGLVE